MNHSQVIAGCGSYGGLTPCLEREGVAIFLNMSALGNRDYDWLLLLVEFISFVRV